ncbi:Crp/Fnr family transcriptional regulator [Mucilaginibacter lappiensis]|uniref:CRP-like cAMP-binding protein n=1 Tax=Mucilaginibacter lappiensis TaxID=354630 RepID=A0A841J8D5_9SPHI|nr:Crp/Fnr family transcriptional regulator [Mucilaginibacter lappiensis]MBB6126622.1 CRP-like cAMP-binding protein [Mucilaginibacter lappiensis]
MKELINCLSKYSTLSGQHMELITNKAKLLSLKKGDCFLEVGRVAKQLGFVMEGVLRVCWYNNSGEDITRAFIPEHHFALNISSFNNETPSEVCFEAISNCKLLVFSKKDLTELSNTIPGWNDILLKITATALTNKSKISQNMLTQDATTRYLEFLKIYPGLTNRIPLSALASYLGIKQSSLSRIRKKIT